MPTIQYAVASKSVSVDQQTNSLSIFDIIEDIAALNFPISINELVFTCAVQREPDEPNTCAAEIEISFRDAAILTRVFEINFGTKLKSRLVIRTGGLPISEPGVLSCVIRGETLNGIGNYRIGISQIQEIPEAYRDGEVTVHGLQNPAPI